MRDVDNDYTWTNFICSWNDVRSVKVLKLHGRRVLYGRAMDLPFYEDCYWVRKVVKIWMDQSDIRTKSETKEICTHISAMKS